MKYLIETLKFRNEPLFLFGLICLIAAIVCVILIKYSNTEVMGINAWYKPLKFCLSTTLFCWAMAWYVYYLGSSINVNYFNWVVIVFLGFEIIYIVFQAGKGELSHFNVSTPVYSSMYSLMALAATSVSIYTAYIGWKFLIMEFPSLPDYYVWSIRIALILFVLFSLQGFMMGSQMAHTVGAADGSEGLPLVNWSKKHGDLRIAHFIGMHALQVLPILSYYVLQNVKLTILVGLLYAVLAIFTLLQAMQGKPLFR